MRPMMEMLRPFFAFLWLFVITVVWSFFSRNKVINLEPRILWILYGTIFSNIAVSFQSIETFLEVALSLNFIVPPDRGPNVGYTLR